MTTLVHIATVPVTLDFLDGQIEFMRGRGFDVTLISSPGPTLERIGQRGGATTYACPMSRSVSPFRDLIALVRLVRLLRRIKPAIVHTHTPKASLLGMVAAFFLRVPVRVYTLHGVMIETRTGWRQRIVSIVERVVCRLAQRVFAVSTSVRNAVEAEGLCPSYKVRVICHGSCNGIDTVKFDPQRVSLRQRAELRESYGISEDALVIGFVGRVTRDKGIAELASAWAAVRDEYPRAWLMAIGPDEPADPTASEIARRLAQDPRVVRIQWTERMREHYALLRLLVLPSYREGFPYAVLEASAMALPVVATRVTGCTDAVVEGETGMLVPARDPQALAHAMRCYLDDPALCRKHGVAARARVVTDFRQEPIWEAMYEEYVRLLHARGEVVPPFAPGMEKAPDVVSMRH